jgi:TetR/AcrR family transcriptional regulator, transcriptional repressor of aconitase
MPKVSQQHLDDRRQQIVDAARVRFASHGFARTSMADLVDVSGLSIGAIYRYFSGKEEIVLAICEQSSAVVPTELTAESVDAMLAEVRAMSRDHDHARLVAQIYAEAAVTPSLAIIVGRQLDQLRASIAALMVDRADVDPAAVAETFVAICVGFNQQLAVRGDIDHAPFSAALTALVSG